MTNASNTYTLLDVGGNWPRRYVEPTFVNCEDYQRFLDDTGAFRQPIHWVGGNAPQEGAAPVLGVYPDDARAFCRWLSQKTAMTWRLPHPGALEGALGVQVPYGYWTREGKYEQPAAA